MIFISLVCFLLHWNTTHASSAPSFYEHVGQTDWQMVVKDVTIGLKQDNIKFELTMGNERRFSFRAYLGNDRYKNRFGTLQAQYLQQLSGYSNKYY